MRSKNSRAHTKAESARKGWHERRFEARPTAVHSVCRQCGRDMWLPASKVGLYMTCGGACQAAWKSDRIEARRRNCATCGRAFTPRSTQLAIGQGIYCSQKCNAALIEAGQSPIAREKQRVARLASVDSWAHKCRGERSPRWKGGRKATYERMKAAGCIRNANNKRRDKRKRSLARGVIPRLERLQRMKCANCRACLRRGYHLDHIVPISKGGAHEERNVQLLCPPCNRRKSARMPIEWAQLNGRLL